MCAAISLVGDGGIYVVLPVVFAERGLSPVQVGVILSANRWARLVTNAPAAHVLGVHPSRTVFAGALFAGGVSSLLYGASTSFPVLVAARCLWGGCWSVIRLTGMLAVTDCVDVTHPRRRARLHVYTHAPTHPRTRAPTHPRTHAHNTPSPSPSSSTTRLPPVQHPL